MRCLKKTAFQVCTVIIMYLLSCIFKYPHIVLLFLHLEKQFVILIAVYFRRLKINHDTHEFILESGTVTNRRHFNKTVRSHGPHLKEKKEWATDLMAVGANISLVVGGERGQQRCGPWILLL